MKRRVLLFVNPHARQGRQRDVSIAEQLRTLGLDVLDVSNGTKPLSELIRLHRQEVSAVVIGGGDGTLNSAAAALVETKLPLGIIPLGTANDLARTLSLPTDIPAACQLIAAGHTRQIDVGWVNDFHFFNAASIGLSVQVAQRLTKTIKSRWGVFAYLITVVRALWHLRRFHAVIRCEGKEEHVRTVQITVGNGRHYGGGMTVAENASIESEVLNLHSLNVKHWWQLIPLLPALRSGSLDSWPQVLTLTGREIEVITRRRRRVNTDGEVTTHTPARFRVLPKAVTVFVQNSTSEPG